jgi:hypothetical protein
MRVQSGEQPWSPTTRQGTRSACRPRPCQAEHPPLAHRNLARKSANSLMLQCSVLGRTRQDRKALRMAGGQTRSGAPSRPSRLHWGQGQRPGGLFEAAKEAKLQSRASEPAAEHLIFNLRSFPQKVWRIATMDSRWADRARWRKCEALEAGIYIRPRTRKNRSLNA